MNKNYIIDAYNLGFKIPAISDWIKSGETEKAIQLIINYVTKALIRKANKIIIVFDGKSGNPGNDSRQGKVQILFSKKPESADDIIRRHMRSLNNASEWIVVTSDSEIRWTAEDMGAQVISSENFIVSQLQTGHKNKTRINQEKYNPEDIDMDYWLNKFNESGDETG